MFTKLFNRTLLSAEHAYLITDSYRMQNLRYIVCIEVIREKFKVLLCDIEFDRTLHHINVNLSELFSYTAISLRYLILITKITKKKLLAQRNISL